MAAIITERKTKPVNQSAILFNAASVRKWTTLIPGRNLFHVLAEHTAMLLHFAMVVALFENAVAWGIPQWAFFPISVYGVIISGILIHRIALLGHESSHYLLAKDRKWNDLLADVLCFFPIWSNLTNYRRKHLGHHLHPNEAGKDPNLSSDRAEALFKSFPMKRPSSIFRYYALFFWPPFVLGNLVDIFKVLVVGPKRASAEEPAIKPPLRERINPGFVGVLYIIALFGVLTWAKHTNEPVIMIGLPLLFHLVVGLGGVMLIPDSVLQRSGGKINYNKRLSAALRLTFGATILIGATWVREYFDFHFGFYYFWFWLFPLLYVLPYLMLLREVYQHANLGTGTIDNSRIIHADPFTRWALLPFGNDYHLIHHIYPNIPHYHLRAAHLDLLDQSEDYRNGLTEVEGNVKSSGELLSVSESLASLSAK
jgi:fatty acid desaturase